MSARSKEEALTEIPSARCDVLLTDISLPDGNGWELFGEVGKSRPAHAIAMSGYRMRADGIEAPKPVRRPLGRAHQQKSGRY